MFQKGTRYPVEQRWQNKYRRVREQISSTRLLYLISNDGSWGRCWIPDAAVWKTSRFRLDHSTSLFLSGRARQVISCRSPFISLHRFYFLVSTSSSPHHLFISSSSSAHHLLITSSSHFHLQLITFSISAHQLIISSSTPHHFFIISSPLSHLQLTTLCLTISSLSSHFTISSFHHFTTSPPHHLLIFISPFSFHHFHLTTFISCAW